MLGRARRRGSLAALVLAALGLLAGCAGLGQGGPTPAPSEMVFKTAYGLEVTALAAEQNELAQKLAIRHWRFRVKLPASGQMFRHDLVVLLPGEEPRVVAGLSIIPDRAVDAEVLVALDPLDTSLLAAGELKFYVENGESGAAGVIENPCGNTCTTVAPAEPAILTEEGYFTLLRFGDSGPIPAAGNAVLALRVSAVPPQR